MCLKTEMLYQLSYLDRYSLLRKCVMVSFSSLCQVKFLMRPFSTQSFPKKFPMKDFTLVHFSHRIFQKTIFHAKFSKIISLEKPYHSSFSTQILPEEHFLYAKFSVSPFSTQSFPKSILMQSFLKLFPTIHIT